VGASTVLVDGRARDTIGIGDRGLAFGDGVFRTIAVRAGRPLNLRWHLRRLASDCAALGLPVPGEALLAGEIAQVAPGDGVVKVILTRGDSTRGYAPVPGAAPTRIVAGFPPVRHEASRARDGVAVRRCSLTLSEQPRLAGVKSLNRLENVLARAEWDDVSIAEGLLGDPRGHVVEGVVSNVFVVKDQRVRTPELTRCGVIGAQRERVRELLGAAGVECSEADIGWDELEAADEVFLTNSLIDAWPVARLGSRTWPVGPVTRRVQAMIAQDDARD